MKINIFLLQVVLIQFTFCTNAQKLSNYELDKVRNSEQVSYKYKDSLLGCNYDLTCQGFQIEFKEATYEKRSKMLAIKGIVFAGTENRPIHGVELFIAKQKDGNLFDLTKVDSTSKSDVNNYPKGFGEFSTSFKIENGYRLYFLHPGYYLVEFDIDRLKLLMKDK